MHLLVKKLKIDILIHSRPQENVSPSFLSSPSQTEGDQLSKIYVLPQWKGKGEAVKVLQSFAMTGYWFHK